MTSKTSNRLVAVVAASVLALGAFAPALQAQPQTLADVLRAMQTERDQVAAENREREERFRQEQVDREAELNRVRNEVQAAEEEASRLENLRNELDRELEELRAQLTERQGEFGELFGVARAAAADLNEELEESLISSQKPGRGEGLSRMAQAGTLPTIDELEGLWFTMLDQATEQGRVVRYEAPVIRADNTSVDETVVRVGPFTAFTDRGFMTYEAGTLRYLPRQPGGGAVRAAQRVFNHTDDGVVRGMIDPSLGTLLGLVIETPTIRERIDQGQWIGYAIIVVAIFGILLAVYRWVVLTVTSIRVRKQMKSSTPSENNPLGRIMLAYNEHRHEDLETLQLHLDDAVLKEIPKLERGLNLVKVLAAVAPLMGLLGTVIGMIVTFQAITLFGTGDPQLMAGGISQALITTVLGLIAAVPLLLLHAFAAGASRRLSQVLEEQSVSFVADAGDDKK
ncbi:MotA/TolQ/ExbB proton channel family protein [Wenzhouxiangella sp. AB-CW3]|uniref:MotA/TolQ/ExbB proton channel family protein n=1 Tax=Wenzhouxiangella sp. AB-CW3 TaxID=2771012 RepID=UPI00168AE7D4|nr:MotA/TolQ/ExbB proton channel family protein [Wenzhouxiangella sp. AB-CW3]QOC22836.1 MotA/TolQ/ExbB proton channel family protein [Wenzhouxiangella sp. AB-CW3]